MTYFAYIFCQLLVFSQGMVLMTHSSLSWIWLPLTTTAHHPWTTSPIMHCTHTFKQHSHMHSPRSLVLPRLTFWAFPLYSVSLCLPGLPIYSDRLLPAFWLCLPFDILSVCCLPRPLHCPCCWFCLACVTPLIASDPCLFDLALLFIKAAFGS